MKNIEEIEQYLENLGLSWITIAEALCDENIAKAVNLMQKNPKISKTEFLQKMQIVEEND